VETFDVSANVNDMHVKVLVLFYCVWVSNRGGSLQDSF